MGSQRLFFVKFQKLLWRGYQVTAVDRKIKDRHLMAENLWNRWWQVSTMVRMIASWWSQRRHKSQGSVCKVRTKDPENYDEEVKSLVTAWRLSRLVSSIGQAEAWTSQPITGFLGVGCRGWCWAQNPLKIQLFMSLRKEDREIGYQGCVFGSLEIWW